MRILFITEMGKNHIRDTEILPRVGDKVDLFWYPYPTVNLVLLYPTKETLLKMGYTEHLDAIVTVE